MRVAIGGDGHLGEGGTGRPLVASGDHECRSRSGHRRRLPTIWYRNRWSWDPDESPPRLEAVNGEPAIVAHHADLGVWRLDGFGADHREETRTLRQAAAGMLWSKQFFHYDVGRWLEGDQAQPPPPPERLAGRNAEWTHLDNRDIVSMPDPGSTRGMRPGTWRFTASRSPISIPNSPNGS